MSGELTLVHQVQAVVWRRFRYVSDSETHPGDRDHWQTHWRELQNSPTYTIRGDCDDLACTVIDGLLSRGWPRDRAMLAMVAANRSKTINHLIGLVEADDGEMYVVGDTFSSKAVPIKKCPHKIMKYVRMDNRRKVMDWEHSPKRPPSSPTVAVDRSVWKQIAVAATVIAAAIWAAIEWLYDFVF